MTAATSTALQVKRKGVEVRLYHGEGGLFVVHCRNVPIAKEIEQILSGSDMRGKDVESFVAMFGSRYCEFRSRYYERMKAELDETRAERMSHDMITIEPRGGGWPVDINQRVKGVEG